MDISKLMAMAKGKKQALTQRQRSIKPNPGSNRYVLMPGWEKGAEHNFSHDFGQHYVKNAAGELQAVYVCANRTHGGAACGICDAISAAMKNSGDDATTALLKEATSKQSYLLNVLALDSDDAETPQILEVGSMVFKQVLELIEEWAGAVFDPSEPQIITINREGKGLNTKYTVQVSPKKHAMPRGVFAKINNLAEHVAQESEEQERRALLAVNQAAGMLPPPRASLDRPRTPTAEDSLAVQSRRDAEATRDTGIDLESSIDEMFADLD